MGHFGLLVGAFAITVSAIQQAVPTCLATQQRAFGAPYTSATITDTLLQDITSKTGICYGGFSTLHNGAKQKVTRRSNGSLVLQATRHAQNVKLGEACIQALSAIVNSCIGESIYWGGNFTTNNVEYAVYNEAFPKNWVPASASSSAVSKPVHKATSPKIPVAATPAASKPLYKAASSRKPVTATPAASRPGHKATPPKKPVNPTSVHPSPTKKPAVASAVAKYKTAILSGVTGVPGSFSQTTTTGQDGLATVLPIWFGAAGIAAGVGILLTPLVAGVVGVPPPPPGLPPVEIGPDGRASPSPHNQDPTPTYQSSHAHNHPTSSLSTVSSRSVPSSKSSSTTSASASPSASASTSVYMISPKDPHSPANDAFTTELRRVFGSRLVIVENIISGLILWAAPLTESQAAQYRSNVVVSYESKSTCKFFLAIADIRRSLRSLVTTKSHFKSHRCSRRHPKRDDKRCL